MGDRMDGHAETSPFALMDSRSMLEDVSIVPSNWVFRWRSDKSGQVVKITVGVVVSGFSQFFGVD